MRCTAAVTNQFHIAAARHLVISPPALHGHRPFPIKKTLLDFLIGEIGLRAHIQLQGRHAHAPRRRIACAVRAPPLTLDLQVKFVACYRPRRTRSVHPHAAAVRVCRAVAAPQLIKHQLLAASELQREPVPACLTALKRGGGPLAVHPARTHHRKGLLADTQRTRARHARVRVVIARVAGRCALLAEPLLALQHEGLVAREAEIERDLLCCGMQRHGKCRRARHRPVLQPHAKGLRLRAREPKRRAAVAFLLVKAAPGDIGECEVGEIDLTSRPLRGTLRIRRRRERKTKKETHKQKKKQKETKKQQKKKKKKTKKQTKTKKSPPFLPGPPRGRGGPR